MVWRNGLKRNTAGGFDGHPTNSTAYTNNSFGDAVYSANDPAYATRDDENRGPERVF